MVRDELLSSILFLIFVDIIARFFIHVFPLFNPNEFMICIYDMYPPLYKLNIPSQYFSKSQHSHLHRSFLHSNKKTTTTTLYFCLCSRVDNYWQFFFCFSPQTIYITMPCCVKPKQEKENVVDRKEGGRVVFFGRIGSPFFMVGLLVLGIT